MKRGQFKRRQLTAVLLMFLSALAIFVSQYDATDRPVALSSVLEKQYFGEQSALEALESLEVKGRAPKTNYSRDQFGDGWSSEGLCDMRNIILARDLASPTVDEQCKVQKGDLSDPYTGLIIAFQRGPETSAEVQIDHVVALSDAWQKGAQNISFDDRVRLANDPLNLLAVDGPANQQKSDGDAATWLPPNKAFRCQYVARQVAVKKKYHLWVTEAERQAISRVLGQCRRAEPTG